MIDKTSISRLTTQVNLSMKSYIYNKVFALLAMICLGFAGAFGLTTLEQADSAYNAQNFRMALGLYNKVLDTQGSSSELYYNIGNANYRVGNVGRAIVNYERALQLDPSNSDARANLDFVRSTLRGLPEDGSSFLSNLHMRATSLASPDGWAVTALVLFLLVLGCAGIYLFASNTSARKFGFFGGIVVGVFFVYTLIIAWQTSAAPERDDIGIVIRSGARLTSNPGTTKNKNEKTIAIPEGSKIEIIDSLATPNDPVTAMWYNVVLNNNTHAWIDASDVDRI